MKRDEFYDKFQQELLKKINRHGLDNVAIGIRKARPGDAVYDAVSPEHYDRLVKATSLEEYERLVKEGKNE